MPRKLKPYKIKEISSGRWGQGSTWILLDRNQDPAVFYAEVGGVRVSAKSADECERLVVEEWKAQSGFCWRQIVVVTTCDRSNVQSAP